MIWLTNFYDFSVSWWSFTGVWVTTSLLGSPRLILVILLISPQIFNFLTSFSRLLKTVPSARTNNYWFNMTHMFHSFFFSSRARSKYLSFCFLLFSLCGPLEWQNPVNGKVFFSCWLTLSLVFWPGIPNLFVFQNSREFSRTYSGLFIYRLVILLNLSLLNSSQWISFPTQSYLILYFYVILLHSISIFT